MGDFLGSHPDDGWYPVCRGDFSPLVQYLGFEEKQFYFPEGVHSMKLDTERLMEDIQHSGIHGKGTRSRLHSGILTLHAAEKEGLSGIFPGLFYMAFPPAKNLLWRFPYLKSIHIFCRLPGGRGSVAISEKVRF